MRRYSPAGALSGCRRRTPEDGGDFLERGAYGEKVTTASEVGPVLKRGLGAVQKQGTPAVLEFWLPKRVTAEV